MAELDDDWEDSYEGRWPDANALDHIAFVLHTTTDWNADTLDAIAEIVRGRGREIEVAAHA